MAENNKYLELLKIILIELAPFFLFGLMFFLISDDFQYKMTANINLIIKYLL